MAFKPHGARVAKDTSAHPEFVSFQGSVEGGTYSHRAAHFEWLCDVGQSVGLSFDQLGKRRHGTLATLHFCDALFDIYGSEDPSTSIGASFAIEHWANAGFWDQLVQGFEQLNARLPEGQKKYPMGFWRFHQKLEAQHAAHTMDELEEAVAEGLIGDEAKFVDGANRMLDACEVFWAGLDATRKGEVLSSKALGFSNEQHAPQPLGKWGVRLRRPTWPTQQHRAREAWMRKGQK